MIFRALSLKTSHMKGNTGSNQGQAKGTQGGHQSRPQNKDDIDSRSNEEQDSKGDDVTHNKKEVRNNRQQKEKK